LHSNPRRAAFDLLLRIEKERSFADLLIDRELSTGTLTGPDRRLFTELVYGLLRRQGTLDHFIAQFSSTPVAKLERSVLLLLRLGLYQTFFLDRVPVSAAVNETVKMAKQLAPRAANFINAVLRSADRGRLSIVYPDRDKEPVAYLAARYSHPAWIVEGWLDQLGMDEAEELAAAMSLQAPLTIRANTLKISRAELQQRLTSEGVISETCRFAPTGLTLAPPVAIGTLASFREGLFAVQDESSQLAALFLSPAAGERILDLCAAPGGKATALAQLMGDQGTIAACDKGERKLRLIRETTDRLGISAVTPLPVDATAPFHIDSGPFDRVLVDAPCAGLGVIRRNPEGKWWREAADITRLAATQQTILDNASSAVASGGLILYATCSTTTVENETVIDNFLSQHQEFMIEDLRPIFPQFSELLTPQGFFRSWPHRHGLDGFFAARLRKKS